MKLNCLDQGLNNYIVNFNLVKTLLNKLEGNPEFFNNQDNKKFIDWAKKHLNKILTD